VFFPGSTIGNFTPAEALVFLRQARKMAGAGGVLLVGVDLKKDKATLDAAYADPRGVTAQFNLNLLHRINRELAADFQVKRFRHRAFYEPIMGRIEMHLESLYSQFVHVAGRRFDFAPGETIHTEISCKYSIAEFQELGKRAGFTPEKVWTIRSSCSACTGWSRLASRLTCGLRPSARVPAGSSRAHAGSRTRRALPGRNGTASRSIFSGRAAPTRLGRALHAGQREKDVVDVAGTSRMNTSSNASW